MSHSSPSAGGPPADGREPWAVPPAGYLDATGGVPLLPSVRAAVEAAGVQGFADPGQLHHAGRRAALLLQTARASVAGVTGVHADEVYFAPSGPAAVAALVDGTLAALPADVPASAPEPWVLASAVESRTVLDAVARHANRIAPVDRLGRIDLSAVQRLDAGAPVLACVQAANIEVGTAQAVDEVAAALPGTPVLADITGVLGREPLPGGWTMAFGTLRDVGGPAGVAVVLVRRGHRWALPPSSARGWLGGVPDVAAAVGAATALEALAPVAAAEAARLHDLVAHLRARIAADVADVDVAGDPQARLPHALSASVLYVDGEALVSELDRLGFAVASGSACVSDETEPSHVLAAMGVLTGGNVRVSLPFGTSQEAVDRFADAFASVVRALRQRYL